MARNGFLRQATGDLSFVNSTPFARLLDAAAVSNSGNDACRVHARIIKSQFSSEVFILNKLIDAYGKCGCDGDARKLFDKMPVRNTYSWNAVISAALNSTLLDESEQLFRAMPERDQCSWNTMIAGFVQHNMFEEALDYFAMMMHSENIVVNEYSFGSSINACAGLKDLNLGKQIHGLMLKNMPKLNVYVGSALVDMYGKCASVDCAQKIFEEMHERNIVSWNSLISCYEQNGPASKALEVLIQMLQCGSRPDEVTLASAVSACATMAAIKQGKEIHACVVKSNKLRDDVILSNALVDMYAKCNRISEARVVFGRMMVRTVVSETSMVSAYAGAASMEAAKMVFAQMSERNVVSWNALIAGYTQNGQNEEALHLYHMLKRESVCPTHYTFGNLLNACANLADLQLGRQVHTHVLKNGSWFRSMNEPGIFVGNSLVDMYMKCGSVGDGFRVFEKMAERDSVSWNTIIMGHAQNGFAMEALGLFKRMLDCGQKPDHVTMIGVLCACSHGGFVEEGRHFFFSMTKEYGVSPLKDHFTCMADLLGRAGCLEEAKSLIEMMPMKPDAVVWGSLLGACKVHGNISLGKFVAEKLLEIEPTNSGPYVLLSNMYAELGRWKDVLQVRKMMKQHGVSKQPGCSWIEVLGKVHVFMVKDRSHPRRKDIILLLKMLTKETKILGQMPAFHEENNICFRFDSSVQ